MSVNKFTLTIFPKLPLKISQNSCQRLVGNVLLAYSSLFSLPLSNLVIRPFFCGCPIDKLQKNVFADYIYHFFYAFKRTCLSIVLQICDNFKNFFKKNQTKFASCKKSWEFALTFTFIYDQIKSLIRGADEQK